MKLILKFFINLLARAYIVRYNPMIIAITGNVGKTSTKEAISAVLEEYSPNKSDKKVNFRVSGGNLNNELGVPLTILGDWTDTYYSSGGNLLFWAHVLLQGFICFFVYPNYPEVLVLEYGADHPGDIKYLASRFRPHIAVVTAIGKIPVHVEFFSSPEAVGKEKSELVKALRKNGTAVLNYDDPIVREMKPSAEAKTITYGFNEFADISLSSVETKIENDKPTGVTFKLLRGTNFLPVKIKGSLGASQAFASGVATAVGLGLGMNLVDISRALSENYKGPAGRMRILSGIKKTTIIDDTYNASPASMEMALQTINGIPAGRKIAVLGDMLELGEYTPEAHQSIGNISANIVDILICVGSRSKFIAESAMDSGLNKSNVLTFDTSEEAKLAVQNLIEPGDLILIKGSQSMRMEKIVEDIMLEPELKKSLLVRQSNRWLKK